MRSLKKKTRAERGTKKDLEDEGNSGNQNTLGSEPCGPTRSQELHPRSQSLS